MSVVAKRDVGVGGRGSELFIISIVFTAVAICFVAMRLATRLKLGKMLGLDDYAIMLSMVIYDFFLSGKGCLLLSVVRPSATSLLPSKPCVLHCGLTLPRQCFSIAMAVANCLCQSHSESWSTLHLCVTYAS